MYAPMHYAAAIRLVSLLISIKRSAGDAMCTFGPTYFMAIPMQVHAKHCVLSTTKVTNNRDRHDQYANLASDERNAIIVFVKPPRDIQSLFFENIWKKTASWRQSWWPSHQWGTNGAVGHICTIYAVIEVGGESFCIRRMQVKSIACWSRKAQCGTIVWWSESFDI